MSMQYKKPPVDPSSVGEQLQLFMYQKQALIEAQREQYFMQLADVTGLPKHFGKSIKRYLYLPLLDDRNINDQGIDANGVSIANGNLYGSSRDIGTIPAKLPVLTENGGRVNRVGYTRKTLEGSIAKYGFFSEYTQESMDFDTDAELMMHLNREMIVGATEITEDVLAMDIVNNAGLVKYSGSATSLDTISDTSVVTYGDLIRLGIDLDNNHTPKQTTIITGSRYIDTRVIPGGRVMYIGSELLPTLMAMQDFHQEKAFIEVQHYAAAGTILNGEVGSIGQFRIVVVPDMLRWSAGGAVASGAPAAEFYTSQNEAGETRYDVFPMLVVGDKAFTTIGFQTDGKTVKFKINHKRPDETVSRSDPYGETGFMSIKWYYGFMALRPERIGLVLTAAKM